MLNNSHENLSKVTAALQTVFISKKPMKTN